MKRPLLACAIIGLWLICLAPTMPPAAAASKTMNPSAVQSPAPTVPSTSTNGLSASVSLSYAFPALLAASAAAYSWGYMGTSVDSGSMTDSHLTTLNTLPFSYYFYYYDAAGSHDWVAMDVVTVFEGLTGVGTYNTQHDLQVCYSGITTFTWNITTWFYDISTNAWVQQDCHVGAATGPAGTYTLLDTPSLTYTTSYIDATGDFRVKVRGWAQISAAGGGYILGNRMRMNQPRTTRTTMTETRRSSFATQGGTVLYTLAFMAPESMTSITVTYPIAWDWQSLQPNANVAETSGQVVITNTDQDTVYSASFTAPVLATASWQSVYAESFEALGAEYVKVVDGAASRNLTSQGFKVLQAWTSASWIVWSSYGSVTFSYASGSSATAGAASKWTTTCTYAASISYLNFTGSNCLIDGVTVYQSDVSAGSTITGTCRHIHPMGATGASFVNVTLGLWDAAYAWKAYRDVTTDAEGAWSLAATTLYAGLAAGGSPYKLWTFVYARENAYFTLDSATEATTDWSEVWGTSSTLTTSTDCKEGAASVYNQARFSTSDWIRPTYNPTGTWCLTNTLVTAWVKVNSTTNVNMVILQLYTDASHLANARLLYGGAAYYYGFAANTWTRMTVPISSSYFNYWAGINTASVDFAAVCLYNSTSTGSAGYGTRVDSLNVLQKYTSDTLTYPFAAPSDWSLQGSFSFNDVYGWAFVASNHAASYTLYENDASRASGSVAANGDNIRWALQTTTGNVSVGIAFTVAGYTGTKWLNTSYTIDANPLSLVTFGCEVGQEEVRLWLVTSWRNCTITITDRHDESGTVHTMVTAAAEAVGSWTYPTTHERGNHTVTVTMNGGAASLTRTSVYWWDWPIDIPPAAPFPPSVIAGVTFTLALQWGLILILVVGLIALSRRIGGVKNLLRGEEERPRPRRRLTPEEQYERPAKEYDRITEEANRR